MIQPTNLVFDEVKVELLAPLPQGAPSPAELPPPVDFLGIGECYPRLLLLLLTIFTGIDLSQPRKFNLEFNPESWVRPAPKTQASLFFILIVLWYPNLSQGSCGYIYSFNRYAYYHLSGSIKTTRRIRGFGTRFGKKGHIHIGEYVDLILKYLYYYNSQTLRQKSFAYVRQ